MNEMNTHARQDADKYIVRFPEGMRDRLKNAAHVNGRSLNSEIITRLQQSFQSPMAAPVPGRSNAVLTEEIAAVLVRHLAQRPEVLARLVLELGIDEQREVAVGVQPMM